MGIVIFILVMSQLALGGNLQFSQFFQKLAWKTGPALVTAVVQGTTFGSRENTLRARRRWVNFELFFVSFYGGEKTVSPFAIGDLCFTTVLHGTELQLLNNGANYLHISSVYSVSTT